MGHLLQAKRLQPYSTPAPRNRSLKAGSQLFIPEGCSKKHGYFGSSCCLFHNGATQQEVKKDCEQWQSLQGRLQKHSSMHAVTRKAWYPDCHEQGVQQLWGVALQGTLQMCEGQNGFWMECCKGGLCIFICAVKSTSCNCRPCGASCSPSM